MPLIFATTLGISHSGTFRDLYFLDFARVAVLQQFASVCHRRILPVGSIEFRWCHIEIRQICFLFSPRPFILQVVLPGGNHWDRFPYGKWTIRCFPRQCEVTSPGRCDLP